MWIAQLHDGHGTAHVRGVFVRHEPAAPPIEANPSTFLHDSPIESCSAQMPAVLQSKKEAKLQRAGSLSDAKFKKRAE
jgi:hypothetical protein